ncbi:hypothetical protein ASPZODRAFT_20327 [Penicilliopsis zonata CBS 506.65]|uniref:Uncharacterized protein n=1 Tax=Penicilliopsis zonata CBS 506.65 TaxID=1073090 RepID=A0A1L9S5X8_9EURO|nr:hypothetical protein ASPZODRAFT_20327 [Penicilliopsis zonata CBS 506.65]OJJ42557.1 hypothetical protein ASPZODRAFT_20327 [Penicilliopsis zonata CBS 506.65]
MPQRPGRLFAKLRNFLRDPKKDHKKIIEYIDQLEWDVMRMFDLKADSRAETIWALDESFLLDIPDSLARELHQVADVLGRDPENEAASRLRLNAILIDCVNEEQLYAQSHAQHDRKSVSLSLETSLALEVRHKGEKRSLNGQADFTVWYDDSGMSTHLVVIEAKKAGTSSDGVTQCLGYMAMVHQIRKDFEKKNAVVFGCSSDGYEFTVLRIDNESRVSKSSYEWEPLGSELDRKRIYTHLRYIIRHATRSSSRRSPKKSVRQVRDHSSMGRPYHLCFGSSTDDDAMEI